MRMRTRTRTRKRRLRWGIPSCLSPATTGETISEQRYDMIRQRTVLAAWRSLSLVQSKSNYNYVSAAAATAAARDRVCARATASAAPPSSQSAFCSVRLVGALHHTTPLQSIQHGSATAIAVANHPTESNRIESGIGSDRIGSEIARAPNGTEPGRARDTTRALLTSHS